MTTDTSKHAEPSTSRAFDRLVTDVASGLSYRKRAATETLAAARVLLLHGVGGNETNLEALGRMIDPRVEVLLVRGPLTFGPSQYGWFEVSFAGGSPVIDAAQADRSRTLLIDLVHALREVTGPTPVPTIIAGFSQAGILSASVGLSSPRDIAGFAILSGRILPEIAPHMASRDLLRTVSAFVAHGTYDAKLPVQWAERSDALLAAHDLRLTSRRYAAGHEIPTEMASDFIGWLDATLSLASGA